MATGRVKWFDSGKGFGFLQAEDGQEVFVHTTALQPGSQALRAADQVEFELAASERGEIASNVRVTESAPPTDNGSYRPARPRTELAVVVDDAIHHLQAVATALQQRGSLGPTAAFNTARSLRRLANRLNPPAS
ncbi:cold-shock protein [Actinokineospora sp. HUAS TT18]|uniref:cold-shock protein n=1 Tax=Actinokineospora sp. HUAS TT18 TaxID=3447451 RepID=UPI003F51DE76